MRRIQDGDQPVSSATATEWEFRFGYLYRTIEEHINAFASQEGCPYSGSDTATRISQLLSHKAVWEQLRNPELVPEMRKNGATAGPRGEPGVGLPAEAVHVPTHVRRTLSADARERIAQAQRARWAKERKEELPPRKGMRVSDQTVADIKAMVARGTPFTQIATELGVSYSSVVKYGKGKVYGRDRLPEDAQINRSNLDPRLIVQIKDMHKEGHTLSHIARTMHVGFNTVVKYATGKVYPSDQRRRSGRKPGGQKGFKNPKLSSYWANMSEDERHAEAMRRSKLRTKTLKANGGKTGPKGPTGPRGRSNRTNNLPKGFWENEVRRLLKDGPRPRSEVRDYILRHNPGKENAFSVALAALKHDRIIREEAGVFTLLSTGPVEAATG